jgi:hypothetical protein
MKYEFLNVIAAFIVWLASEFWWWAVGQARGSPVFPWGLEVNPWKRWLPRND